MEWLLKKSSRFLRSLDLIAIVSSQGDLEKILIGRRDEADALGPGSPVAVIDQTVSRLFGTTNLRLGLPSSQMSQ